MPTHELTETNLPTGSLTERTIEKSILKALCTIAVMVMRRQKAAKRDRTLKKSRCTSHGAVEIYESSVSNESLESHARQDSHCKEYLVISGDLLDCAIFVHVAGGSQARCYCVIVHG